MARVLIRFRDIETWRLYDVGDDWEGSPERAETLSEGGYIQSGLIAHGVGENGSGNGSGPSNGELDGMTVAQLREVAESRDIDVPKRATKARILELLGV